MGLGGQCGVNVGPAACSIMWQTLGHSLLSERAWKRASVALPLRATLRIRNLLATHCAAILPRYFVAVNNALLYLPSVGGVAGGRG